MSAALRHAYITALGTFLPGEPVDNDHMEDVLGRIRGDASVLRSARDGAAVTVSAA